MNSSSFRCFRPFAVLLISTSASAVVPSQPAVPAASGEVDFRRDVYPILKANCIACHNKTTTKGDLNMETPELMKKGGESGPGLVPGKAADSIVLQAAAHEWDSEMPPKGNKVGAVNLTPGELKVLEAWIQKGAKSSEKTFVQIPWQPLPPGLNPIHSVALTDDGRLAACSRANQIFVYDLATRQVQTRLTDAELIKQEIYKNAGVAHRDMVQTLAFSPDGKRLASGSFREVKIWRRDDAAPVLRKADPKLGMTMSVISEDGRQIVGADKAGALHFTEAVSGKIIRTVAAVSPSGIKHLSLSPDASKIAVIGVDGTLSAWSMAEGKRLAGKAGVNGVRAMTWSRDGKILCTGGEDKVVRLWSLPAAPGGDLTPKDLPVSGSVISALIPGAGPDHLLSAGEDGNVILWSLGAAKAECQFKVPGVVALSLSRDGKHLAAGCSDGVVRLFDAQTAKAAVELRGDLAAAQKGAGLERQIASSALNIAFHTAESTRLAAEIKALDERTQKAKDAVAAGTKSLPEKQKALAPAQAAKAAAQKVVDDLTAEVAKAAGGKPDAALDKKVKEAQDKQVAAVKAEEAAAAAIKTTEGQIKDATAEIGIIAEAKTKSIKAVEATKAALATAKVENTKATADLAAVKAASGKSAVRPLAVAFSNDASRVVCIGADGALRSWALTSALPVALVSSASTTSASVAALEDGSIAICVADGSYTRAAAHSTWILEYVLGGDKLESPLVDRVNALSFSPDGRSIAVGSGEPSRTGDITIWEVPGGKLLRTWNERHSDSVLSLDFSPDGKQLASGGADKAVRITEISSGKQTRVLEGHTHHILGIAFRADGRILASAGADNVVKIWDMITGDRKKNIDGWDKEVTSVQFIGATDQILTSAGDNRVRLVRDSGAEVRSMPGLPDFMHSAASTVTGNLIIAGGQDSVLRVWDGGTGKEVVTFAADAH